MFDKTEWPTESRLEELREQGVVPVSLFATRAFGALAFLLSVYLLRHRIGIFYSELFTVVDGQAIKITPELRNKIVGEGIFILAAPVVAVFVTSLAVVLLQTKFLFVAIPQNAEPVALD